MAEKDALTHSVETEEILLFLMNIYLNLNIIFTGGRCHGKLRTKISELL